MEETRNCSHTYEKGETSIVNNYDSTSKELNKINERVRYIKGLLAYSNINIIVEETNMSIGESLIYLV